ncbi:MAG: family 78 glycoside hydrolase catalytic domain [Candidatus Latescibacteria bacterium]|nr:family 78 glycoside hydrolase catalytic domain [Candidatus Latescibacterota bacterium]
MEHREWKSRWIWCDGPERPRNFYLALRKEIRVSGPITEARCRCVADSRYKLFVNGRFVGRGPARSDPRWQSYDQYDLKPFLQPGRNVIAAIVHHYGEPTFSYVLGRGGFLFEGEIGTDPGKTVEVLSDRYWKVKPLESWDDRTPRIDIQLGFTEVYDGRKEPHGWMEPDFDDGAWAHATVIGKVGMEPWPALVPRDIPPLMEELRSPAAVVDMGRCAPALDDEAFHIDFGRRITPNRDAVAYAATYVYSAQRTEVVLHAGSEDGIKIWLNGAKVLDHHIHRRSAPDQEQVDVVLEAGWNGILIKVDQSVGEWDCYFHLEGGKDLIYSAEKSLDGVDCKWRMIGPFDNEMIGDECIGFETPYPPERGIDFDATYEGKAGAVRWNQYDSVAERMTDDRLISSQEVSHSPLTTHHSPMPLPLRVDEWSEDGDAYLVLDFGQEVVGYPRIEVEAPAGTMVDMGYSELLEEGRVCPHRNGVRYADRYIARNGRQVFETFGMRGFRYMMLTFRGTEGPVWVHDVGVNFSTYPVAHRGAFECSDERLNTIWEVGRTTVQLCMHDAYEDCPWREQAQWWGDARVEALVNYYAFGDAKLMARGLRQIAQSQRADGLTQGMVPGGGRAWWLPGFSLIWVISLWEYVLYTGDENLVHELYPNVRRLLSWFDRQNGDRGLLEEVPGWIFTDWTDLDSGGEIAALNALYVGALEAASELSNLLRDEASAAKYKGRAHAVRTDFTLYLWSEEKGVYTDGVGSERVSQHVNVLAALYDIAGEEKRDGIFQTIFEDESDVVQIGSPYFMFYALDALYHSDRGDQAIEIIRKRWGAILDAGATTWWERFSPEDSWCHGWSAGPTYFLSAEILGVKPKAPGFRRFEVKPRIGDLVWSKGIVPTVRGDIPVSWKRDEETFHLKVALPKGCKAEIAIPKADFGHPRILLGGKAVWENGRAVPHEMIRHAREDDEFVWFGIGWARKYWFKCGEGR